MMYEDGQRVCIKCDGRAFDRTGMCLGCGRHDRHHREDSTMATNGTTTGTSTDQLVGIVASVNPKGVRLEGRDDWCNISKWAQDVMLPERGTRVAVTLDKSGFVRAIESANGALPAGSAGPSKDQTITRLACVKAAAEFAASRPELKSADLLALAERMEAWVTRG